MCWRGCVTSCLSDQLGLVISYLPGSLSCLHTICDPVDDGCSLCHTQISVALPVLNNRYVQMAVWSMKWSSLRVIHHFSANVCRKLCSILRLPPGGHLTMATPTILSAFQTERREKEGKRCLSMEITSFKEHDEKLYQTVPSFCIYLFKMHLFFRRH